VVLEVLAEMVLEVAAVLPVILVMAVLVLQTAVVLAEMVLEVAVAEVIILLHRQHHHQLLP
jgi:hypothetical protein